MLLRGQEVQVLHVLAVSSSTTRSNVYLLRLLHHNRMLRTLQVVIDSLILFYMFVVAIVNNIAEFLLCLANRGLGCQPSNLLLFLLIYIWKLGSFRTDDVVASTTAKCLHPREGVAPMHHIRLLLSLVQASRVALRLDKLWQSLYVVHRL